ncbi:MAG: deoxyribodipyrimidine photo-lyase [Nitriliruptoraceae bacterium]
MSTAIVLFTRDLRVHDHPALTAACQRADRVVPLFVFDRAILASRYAAPNRVAQLVDAVRDLRSSLKDLGGELVVRHGDTLAEVHRLAIEVTADELHLSADVSAHARRREASLRALAARELGDRLRVHRHDGVMVVPAGEVRPSGGDHFKVFTPYWRRWVDVPRRDPLPVPSRVPTPTTVATGRIPALAALTDVDRLADELPPGGETAARARAEWWFEGPVDAYDEARNHLAVDGTSKLSHHVHLGVISATELAARVDRRQPGQEAFLQELCWRDFNHQLLAARPDLVHTDIRTQGDDWRDGAQAAEDAAAWKQGRTGYPVVDAGMRQLQREGWMHNRARMIVASFLTKHLYVDWRVGAWHFMDHLVDGDLANNFGQWQWTAGTGTDSRPNRMFNPVTQSERYDPGGIYLRRYVPELAEVDDAHVHAPWEGRDTLLGVGDDYPPPIVDHREARERFLVARGA